MTILVCGGRTYDDYARVEEVLEEVAGWATSEVTIIHGGARGADTLAARWGREYDAKVVAVPADWKTHGRDAGPIRNQQMLDEHTPDQVVAFPGGRGTEDMVLRAMRARLNIWVVSP